MSDLLCQVCGEPWDSYHLRHDAPPWVRPLFLAGAGCESCEGRAREGASEGLRVHAAFHNTIITPDDDCATPPDLSAPRPEWKRPSDERAWACNDCGIAVYRDQDWREGSEFAYQVRGAESFHAERILGVERCDTFASLSDAIDQISLDGTHCRVCLVRCGGAGCMTLISSDDAHPDPNDYTTALCEECHSEAEYDHAIWSYSARDLVESLGYRRGSPVFNWFDSRESITLDQAMDSGLAEIEGSQVRYVYSRRLHTLTRKQLADILRSMRAAVS